MRTFFMSHEFKKGTRSVPYMAALGVMAGVQLFRVHDVKENRQAADVAWAIKRCLKKYEG